MNIKHKNPWLQKILLLVLYLLPILYLVYEVALPHERKPIIPVQSEYDYLIQSAVSDMNNKMPEKSIVLLEKAIAINPHNVVAYNNLCVAYNLMKQYQKGIDVCQQAIKIDQNYQLAKNNLQWAMDELSAINAR